MDLSPEERQRIYQEEKARLEAQSRIRAEKRQKAVSWPVIVAMMLGVCLVLWAMGSISENERQAKWQKLTPEQKDAQTLKNCLELEQGWKFKLYSELTEYERKAKYSCDVFISTGEFPGKRE